MNTEAWTAYSGVCDTIYLQWKSGSSDDPRLSAFDTQYLPEPYLDFGHGDEVCIFLTTNPGGGMDAQLPDGVSRLAGGHIPQSYNPLAKLLGEFYENSGALKGAPLANIKAMRSIAMAMGFSRVLHVEMIPWHSPKLPSKRKVLSELGQHELYAEYAVALRHLLDSASVVLSWSGGDPEKRGGDGVEFKGGALGLDLRTANLLEITRTSRPSQALLWSRQDEKLRGLFVNRAAANLPKRKGTDGVDRHLRIAEAIGG